MNAFTNYLEKLGSNFLVAAMVPSLALVIACVLLFDPILKIATTFANPQGTYQLIGFGLFIFIVTVIIGFTLTALNTYILKIFEGYVRPFPIHVLYYFSGRKHQSLSLRLRERRQSLEYEVRHLRKHTNPDAALTQKLEMLQDQYYKVAADYSLQYPENSVDILPTRFGNILRAAENYSGERYGFDGVHFWPRLVHVIPTDYKLTIDNTRNELSFLVNMSILSVFFSLLCIVAIFHVMGTTQVVSGDQEVFFAFIEKIDRYLLAAGLGFGIGWFFYNASIFSVGSFGLMIRSSMDLFRRDLLKKLELVRPRDSIEEFETWKSINELIVLGSHSLTLKKIDYSNEE